MAHLEPVFWAGGGFATTERLRAAGATALALRKLVDAGRVRRIRRGVYALPAASSAGVEAIRLGGRLAGISAAESFGLWGGWDEPLTVCVPRNSSAAARREGLAGMGAPPSDPSTVLHWTDDPGDDAWCWRVCFDRCLVQVLRWCDPETAVAVLDTGLTAKVVDLAQLLRRVEHSSRLTAVVRRARAGSGSGIESIVRQRLAPTGLRLVQQAEIEGVGFVDFRIDGTRILIEVDGYEFHSSRAQFSNDRRRDAEARARGFVPLRFTALQVRDRWDWVESMVLQAVSRSAGGGVR